MREKQGEASQAMAKSPVQIRHTSLIIGRKLRQLG